MSRAVLATSAAMVDRISRSINDPFHKNEASRLESNSRSKALVANTARDMDKANRMQMSKVMAHLSDNMDRSAKMVQASEHDSTHDDDATINGLKGAIQNDKEAVGNIEVAESRANDANLRHRESALRTRMSRSADVVAASSTASAGEMSRQDEAFLRSARHRAARLSAAVAAASSRDDDSAEANELFKANRKNAECLRTGNYDNCI